MNIWVDANGWFIPPVVLLGCFIAECMYFRGWRVLVKMEQSKQATEAVTSPTLSGFAMGASWWRSWFWRGTFFLAGIFVFLVAASAPIDRLSGRLFWVHMIQHLLLLIIMAPLLVAAAPLLPMWFGLPLWMRRRVQALTTLKAWRTFTWVWHGLRQPTISFGLLIIGVWVWHWPPLYDLALTNDIIHDWCEHLIFLAVSLLFWSQIIPSPPLRPIQSYLGRMGYVGIAIVQNIALAIFLGFAVAPLYAPYAQLATVQGGFTALQDQQFGAGIMWTFGDLPFGITFSILVQKWLALQLDDTDMDIAIKAHTTPEV